MFCHSNVSEAVRSFYEGIVINDELGLMFNFQNHKIFALLCLRLETRACSKDIFKYLSSCEIVHVQIEDGYLPEVISHAFQFISDTAESAE